MGVKRERIDLPPDTVRQLASRWARGVSETQLALEFGFSRPIIKRAIESEDGRALIKEIHYDILLAERAKAQSEIAGLLPLAIEVIKKKLDKEELKAAEMVLKANMLLTPVEAKDGDKQAQTLTVVLPGQAPIKDVIDVSP